MFDPPSGKPRSRFGEPWAACLVAVLAVVVATGVRRLLDPVLGDTLKFIAFFPAVAFAAWYGGLGPGIVAMLAGAALADFFVFEPRYSFAVSRPENQMGFILYGLVSAALIFMFDSYRRALLKVQASEIRYRRLFETAHDGILILDAETGQYPLSNKTELGSVQTSASTPASAIAFEIAANR